MKATWNNQVIAESNQTVEVEGNQYFPPDSVNHDYLIRRSTHTICPWKGEASYYHLDVEGKINPDAAWYYQEPSEKAKKIKGYNAFWKGLEVQES